MVGPFSSEASADVRFDREVSGGRPRAVVLALGVRVATVMPHRDIAALRRQLTREGELLGKVHGSI